MVNSSWDGTATGYGTVFGSLIFDVEDGATGGSVQWVGQAFPPDTDFVNGNGSGTWAQVEGAHRWTISIPVIAVSNGDRVRCEGQVDRHSPVASPNSDTGALDTRHLEDRHSSVPRSIVGSRPRIRDLRLPSVSSVQFRVATDD